MKSSDGLGSALDIVTWIAMIVMVLSVVAKLSSKFVKSSRLMLDDLLLALAMIWASHSFPLKVFKLTTC